MNKYASIDEAYAGLTADLTHGNHEFISHPRDQLIKENLGVTFRVTDPRKRLIHAPARVWNLPYAVAEYIWFISANSSTDWIGYYAPFWKNITDDGTTANSSYGSRMFVPHGRVAGLVNADWNQWDYVIDELSKDNDSRRAVIHIRSPIDSIMAHKDVPCTLSLQYFLRDDRLYAHTTMRSNDIILGLAYDFFSFTMFQEMMANELSRKLDRKIDLGEYIHTSASLHVYEKHFTMAKNIADDREMLCAPTMPEMPMNSPPPTSVLVSSEADIRKAVTKVELVNAFRRHRELLDDYWFDMVLILAQHRSNKIEAGIDVRDHGLNDAYVRAMVNGGQIK